MSHNGSPIDRTGSKGGLRKAKARGKADPQYMRIPQVPIEWYGSTNWRLPSGKAPAEFALQARFLAPLVFKTGGLASTGLPSFCSESNNRSQSFNKAGQP